MTVSIDDARIPFGRMRMCHMVGDSAGELHAFAAAIGLRRAWFHRGHYNCCQQKRLVAIAAGARQVSQRESAAIRARLERQSAFPHGTDSARSRPGTASRAQEKRPHSTLSTGGKTA